MSAPRLGLRENLPQFTLLVVLNAFVGAMVGLERTVLPLLGEQEFGLASKTAITSFIVSFGVTKAILNLVAARLSDRVGRKPILVAGWVLAVPVPFLIIYAPAWWWIDLANVFLGANQALAWSMTVIMKVDLVGPKRRGLALGLNEFAGYFAVGVMSWVTGYIASQYGLRPQPFYLGLGIAVVGLLVAIFLVRETHGFARLEATTVGAAAATAPSFGRIFYVTSLANVSLFAACQAGLVNNLNDGMSWGLYPLFFAAHGLDIARIGIVKAVYPAVWGLLQSRDRAAVRSSRTQASHRVGHGGAGGRDLAHGPRSVLRGLDRRRRASGPRHRDGLPDAARRHHRLHEPDLARVEPRRLSLLA